MFDVKGGLRQGCVMSPWLFNLYIEEVVRGMNREGKGAKLMNRGEGTEVNVLLFADDTVMLAESEDELKELVVEFERECEMNGLKINIGKTKTMKIGEGGMGNRELLDIRIRGESVGSVDKFKYLGVELMENGGMKEEIEHRVSEGSRVTGGLREIFKKGVSREVKMRLYESIFVPTVIYGCESWVLNAKVRKKVEVVEMRILRDIANVRRIDRIRNARVREMCGCNASLVGVMEKRILVWFGHMTRMNQERIVKNVLGADIRGGRGVGRPRKRWLDGVKEIIEELGMTLEICEELAEDREGWRNGVYEEMKRREQVLGRMVMVGA